MVYVFQCNNCSNHFEVSESLAQHERHKEKCPKCDSQLIERRFDTADIQVKTSKKS